MLSRLERLATEVGALQSKLILIVGPPGGKSKLLLAFAERVGATPLSLDRCLAGALPRCLAYIVTCSVRQSERMAGSARISRSGVLKVQGVWGTRAGLSAKRKGWRFRAGSARAVCNSAPRSAPADVNLVAYGILTSPSPCSPKRSQRTSSPCPRR